MSMTLDLICKDGTVSFIAAEDAAQAMGREWYFNRSTGYVFTSEKGQHIRLHRLLTQAPKGVEVDHINRNRRDNRRSNLRLTDRTGNMRNCHRFRVANTPRLKPGEGAALRELRQKAGILVADLAAHIQYEASYVTAVEKGLRLGPAELRSLYRKACVEIATQRYHAVLAEVLA